jgi:hypothetical protein
MEINKQRLIKSLGIGLSLVLIFNVINLIVELFRVEKFHSFSFKHGYFILNESQVGSDIFSNLFNFIIFTIFIYLFLTNQQAAS